MVLTSILYLRFPLLLSEPGELLEEENIYLNNTDTQLLSICQLL